MVGEGLPGSIIQYRWPGILCPKKVTEPGTSVQWRGHDSHCQQTQCITLLIRVALC